MTERAPVRAEVVALLLDVDWHERQVNGRLMHTDGRPFSTAERQLHDSATSYEKLAYVHLALAAHEAQPDPDQRAADQRRLMDIGFASPGSERFAAALAPYFSPETVVRLGEVPLAEYHRSVHERNAGLAAAFRAHVLPDLGGALRAEAAGILDRVEEAGGP
jgi:hypothetical protein